MGPLDTEPVHGLMDHPFGGMVPTILVIQRDTTTGRYHPALYRDAPFPGPGPHSVDRYKSWGHHTEGFDTLEACGPYIRDELCPKLKIDPPVDTAPVVELESAGVDILLRSSAD